MIRVIMLENCLWSEGVSHSFRSLNSFFKRREIQHPEVGAQLKIECDTYEEMKILCLRMSKLNRNWKISKISKLFYRVNYVYCDKPTWLYYYINSLNEYEVAIYNEKDSDDLFIERRPIDEIYFIQSNLFDVTSPVVKFYGKRFEWNKGGVFIISKSDVEKLNDLQPLDEDDMNEIEAKFEDALLEIESLYKTCRFIRNDDGTCEVKEIAQSEELLMKV